MDFLRRHFSRHRYFYLSALAALGVWGVTRGRDAALAGPLAGDIFYCAYIALSMMLNAHHSPRELRKLAEIEDEGIFLIVAITGAAICFSLISLFALLNGAPKPDTLLLVLSVASAPLGWFMLHTVGAFHYAHLFYGGGTSCGVTETKGHSLRFPGTREPTIGDFLYFSFVVGATAQVSDVQVTDSKMRRLVLAHGIVAFFFNTVLLAVAVNVAIALTVTQAQGH